ncbi:SRPBCC family protein [Pseudomonas sp. NA-150]|uniref:sterol desaturase/SRPBCC family protein n=1 Tax=Pseudomonas sp. NA-150 TaxID=3367525 RepID=UPI0037C63CAA
MKFDTTNFRMRYRAGTHPLYNAWLHAGFVLVFGMLAIAFFWSHAEHVRPWEWLAIPVALVIQNWGEYMVHKHLGHHKRRFSALFYKRHTGDHHSFFAYGQMSYERKQDWRVILFPAWLIVLVTLGVLAGWWVLSALNGNIAALFSGSLLVGYLSYEILHAFEHLPDQHPISRLPWVRQMRRLHQLHHARDLMHRYNFNIVFPLWDWVYGTLYWQTEEHRENPTNRVSMQHHIDIQRAPEHVLRYVSTPTRWHEWHPYPVAIKGATGVLPMGSQFEYTSARADYLSWEIIDYVPGQRWQARARGKYGLTMVVTYQCLETATGTRFIRTLEYQFSNWIGRVADRLILRKRLERDAVELLSKLGTVAEQVIPAPAEENASH